MKNEIPDYVGFDGNNGEFYGYTNKGSYINGNYRTKKIDYVRHAQFKQNLSGGNLSVSSDGLRAAFNGANYKTGSRLLWVWEPKTNRVVFRKELNVRDPNYRSNKIGIGLQKLNWDGSKVFTSYGAKYGYLWDIATGKLEQFQPFLKDGDGKEFGQYEPGFQKGGDYLVVAGHFGMSIWDKVGSKWTFSFKLTPSLDTVEFRAVQFSPDGKKFALKQKGKAPVIIALPSHMWPGAQPVRDEGVASTNPPKKTTTNNVAKAPAKAPAKQISNPLSFKSQPNTLAIVIGNQDYEYTPDVTYAARDAKETGRYLQAVLGLSERKVKVIENADFRTMRAQFGAAGAQGRLHRTIPAGTEHVIVYYSGHGAPGIDPSGTNQGYFLPVDGDAGDVYNTGYAFKTLVANLATLPVKRVTVLLDACFTGLTPAGTLIPNTSGTFGIKVVAPKPQAKVSVLSATSFGGIQVANWRTDKQHGAFTWHMLQGLAGFADLNRDKSVTMNELHSYIGQQIKLDVFNNDKMQPQTPTLTMAQQDYALVQLQARN
ncbi:MAG: caspase family protein [Lentilitoribacter sp.]